MTKAQSPAQKAGISIGDKFKVIVDGEGGGYYHEYRVGDIIEFNRDDNSDNPRFKRVSDGKIQYMRFELIEKIEDTPASRRGLEVGKKYRIVSGYPEDHDFPVGTVVTFTCDDGSECPRFDGENDSGDGYHFPYLRHIGGEVVDGEDVGTVITFKDEVVQVPKDTTVITVQRKLTQAERDAIAAIINQ